MYYVNCRHCSSIGSENICSSCCLIGEHKDLPSLKVVNRRKIKTPSAKKLAMQECLSFVKSLKTEEVEY